jgi:uncharacterized SAM-binding protein YcdF (DUF218 family)
VAINHVHQTDERIYETKPLNALFSLQQWIRMAQTIPPRSRFWTALLLLVLVLAGMSFFLFSGRMVVLDQPVRSDVILVLDGDNNDVRFWRGIHLLQAGYAKTALVDVRTDKMEFGETRAEAAQQFIAGLGIDHVQVCPGRMQSTAEEVDYVARCLATLNPHQVLIITSPYHTRRALTIFRHRLPQYQWRGDGGRRSGRL